MRPPSQHRCRGALSAALPTLPVSGAYFTSQPVKTEPTIYLDNCEFRRISLIGIRLRCSPDGEEQTRLVYQVAPERLVVEPNESSLSTVVDRDMHKAPVSLDPQGRLRLHIYLDRSVLEVFANDDTCLASRIYPTRPDSLGLDLFSRGGPARLIALDIYSMASIWD